MVEFIFGVPVQDGRGPVEVDVVEEVVLEVGSVEELVVTGILLEIACNSRILESMLLTDCGARR